MISEDKLNKYSELICKYIYKFRSSYGLKGKILLNISVDSIILGNKLKERLSGSTEVDFITFEPFQDIGYLNSKSVVEKLQFVKGKTSDLLKYHDTIIKIDSTNQGLNDVHLEDKFKKFRLKEQREYLNQIESLEEQKRFVYLRCYLFSETSEKYYNQRIDVLDKALSEALFLDSIDPFQEIEKRRQEMAILSDKLNNLKIDKLEIKGDDYELLLELDNVSSWVFSNLRNFPSYELFTCPRKNRVSGNVRFNNSIFYNGVEIKDALLKFKDGEVIEYSSSTGIDELKSILETPGGNYIGEIGITDKHLSPIRTFSKCTMFDENISGDFGNFHIALGNSYSRCYKSSLWNKLRGSLPNKSILHVDFINTNRFEIKAKLKNGKEMILFKEGRFLI